MDNFFAYISNVVRNHRKMSGLSQNELAEMAGVGKTTVFDIEHAKASVQVDNLLKVFRVLNIDVSLSSPLLDKESGE